MKLSRFLRTCAGALLMSLFSAGAAYAQTYCSDPGAHPDNLSVDEMTLNGQDSTDCYGVVSGNINSVSDLNNLGLTWGSDWTIRLTSDGTSTGTFEGLQLTLQVVGVGDTSGTWEVLITDTNGTDPLNLPATLDLVGALKAGDGYALYFFDDIILTADNDGTWSISFTNNGGQTPDLSHLDLFVREGNGVVPEPATTLLLGVGLLGLAGLRRRMRG